MTKNTLDGIRDGEQIARIRDIIDNQPEYNCAIYFAFADDEMRVKQTKSAENESTICGSNICKDLRQFIHWYLNVSDAIFGPNNLKYYLNEITHEHFKGYFNYQPQSYKLLNFYKDAEQRLLASNLAVIKCQNNIYRLINSGEQYKHFAIKLTSHIKPQTLQNMCANLIVKKRLIYYLKTTLYVAKVCNQIYFKFRSYNRKCTGNIEIGFRTIKFSHIFIHNFISNQCKTPVHNGYLYGSGSDLSLHCTCGHGLNSDDCLLRTSTCLACNSIQYKPYQWHIFLRNKRNACYC